MRASNDGARSVAAGSSLPPPTGGWDAFSPLANMPADRAVALDNWYPQPGYVELRRGFSIHSDTLTDLPVETVMSYQGPIVEKLFAISGTTIFDVTVAGSSVPNVTGLANARWQHVNFNTSGGDFLWACNGANAPRIFNGTAWSSAVITGIPGDSFAQVATHKGRLWGAIKNDLDAAYLPINSIQGVATRFALSGIFTTGGYLQAIGSWTIDGGNGPDDYIVFASSRGQVAIYSGIDPATDFRLVGLFQLGSPIGRRCFLRIGTDLALISVDGVLPLSSSLALDRGAIARSALTTNIQRVMNQSARDYGANFGWQLIGYPRGTMAILNVPIVENQVQHQYVMNTLTGAWCRFLGQNASCWEIFNDRAFFGGNDGVIYEADRSGSDNGQSIEADMRTAFNYYGQRGNLKRWTMCRPLLSTDGQITPGLGLNIDFGEDAEISVPASIVEPSALWDTAVWDVAFWPQTSRVIADWASVSGLGYCASIRMRVQIQASGTVTSFWDQAFWDQSSWDGVERQPITLQVNGFDMLREPGAFI